MDSLKGLVERVKGVKLYKTKALCKVDYIMADKQDNAVAVVDMQETIHSSYQLTSYPFSYEKMESALFVRRHFFYVKGNKKIEFILVVKFLDGVFTYLYKEAHKTSIRVEKDEALAQIPLELFKPLEKKFEPIAWDINA